MLCAPPHTVMVSWCVGGRLKPPVFTWTVRLHVMVAWCGRSQTTGSSNANVVSPIDLVWPLSHEAREHPQGHPRDLWDHEKFTMVLFVEEMTPGAPRHSRVALVILYVGGLWELSLGYL